ncbi:MULTISPECIES: DoxX family protein [Rhodopseudomonas]|uniref:Membrane protein n=1 Tax=Rhodopseudomonas palustris TaxID=1076 RepID=A0A0D7EQ42_RHOPL|nr:MULTISPECIES: DoxX family protein [Rhodopseudomonas]KIZ42766.1 membrane protein [Rhodopseudomonas palustris]MDF3809533.1 DoxX family protein [Rhodopseudomonas sp. BAL398]WOK19245.1 DoxX family protein [Rhodopseudomonas sp. BAL398]
MPALISFGRFLFAVLFIVSGASKLLDVAATTLLTEKLVMPAFLAAYTSPYVTQLETLTGMPIAQQLAIGAGILELVCGLMIALNFGARFFAWVLVLFVVAATYYYHDFWNQTGAESTNNMIHALKNLSLIGGLFMIAGIGPTPPPAERSYTDL